MDIYLYSFLNHDSIRVISVTKLQKSIGEKFTGKENTRRLENVES